MTPQEFIARWRPVTLSERSACQSHFNDLCELLGQPKPVQADPDGSWYTFERGVRKTTGGNGWADVWMKGRFGWEYKKKRRNLDEAYQQLLLYREDLENPPILVVCDLDRFEIHTNFTGTIKTVYAFDLDGLAEPQHLDVLRKVFTEPEALRPGQTTEAVTQQAARQFSVLSDGMRARNVPAHEAAHFLMKLMFCMFAQDIGLLKGKVFRRILEEATDPGTRAASTPSLSKTRGASPTRGASQTDASTEILSRLLSQLFEAMAHGGYFGATKVLHFNGGLFADHSPSAASTPSLSKTRGASPTRGASQPGVIDLEPDEIARLKSIDALDWSDVEPSVFGTLFERTLDPAKRSQIGAHYTSRADIETLLEPVVMQPLRREWADVQQTCEKLTAEAAKAKTPATKRKKTQQRDKVLRDFVERLSHVSVLDPACGSGNFLYVALHLLLDLEKEVITYAARYDVGLFPQVRPTQLAGIEINEYAQELASVVIWIGYLQWMHHNGFNPPSNPVLEPIDTIRRMDAILDLSNPEAPLEPEWPKAEFIVGNPPFLGGSRILDEIGREYQGALWQLYEQRVPGSADLCCYWFEKAWQQIQRKRTKRAGLLATQGIRGGANRQVLKQIKETGDIFFAESDRNWVLDGALVHVSMVGFDDGSESQRILDGSDVSEIHSNLTTNVDVTKAQVLQSNSGKCFIGTKKAGKFEIPVETAMSWLRFPNPHGRPNSDVLVPWTNGTTLVNGRPSHWIIDTGVEIPHDEFCKYEEPYRYVLENVKPARDVNREERTRVNWWRFKRTAAEMRLAVIAIPRYVATVRHAKHRIFAWVDASIMSDDGIYLFATSDDWIFGVLHSWIHEHWARSQGTQVRDRESGFRYTPTSCFETFPFPEPTEEQREAIGAAAKELNDLREAWLNPPEWVRTEVLEFPGSVDGPWKRYIDPESIDSGGMLSRRQAGEHATQGVGAHGDPADAVTPCHPTGAIGTVKYPRLVPRDEECARQLKKRTLTNLYNQRPTWLDLAHKKLDEAVFAAYGWDPAMSDDELLAALLELNLKRAAGGRG